MPTTDVTPTKPEDEEYTYTFAGWTPRLVKVTSDASYSTPCSTTTRGCITPWRRMLSVSSSSFS